MIEKVKSIWARSYSITKKQGEFYHAKVTDSYGKKYDNYFETADKANKWVYYIWQKEDLINSLNSQELLSDAIANCIQIDKANNINLNLD